MSEDSDRRFIIAYHVYPGSRFNNFALWNDRPNQVYFEMIRRHKDRIIIEIAGHDHLANYRLTPPTLQLVRGNAAQAEHYTTTLPAVLDTLQVEQGVLTCLSPRA